MIVPPAPAGYFYGIKLLQCEKGNSYKRHKTGNETIIFK